MSTSSPAGAGASGRGMEAYETQRRGLLMFNKLLALRDPAERTHYYHYPFLTLPNRQDYPDYYRLIKKPISLYEIKQRLDTEGYPSLYELKSDFNQLFVNAKRYNAAGSPIFLDAKKLHRYLKDLYESATGDNFKESDPEMDPPPPVPSNKPPKFAPSYTGTGTTMSKRGPTLKPWLTKKMRETTALIDPNSGRLIYEHFKSLPAKSVWPHYYQVITHPMSFDSVAAKTVKRGYLSVEEFVGDVERIFSNAQKFNEESSGIWQDARILRAHFREVMKEVPPIFATPRKYNTAKRRAEQEAIAAGLPIPIMLTAAAKRARLQSQSEPPEDEFDDYESEVESQQGGYGAGGGNDHYDPNQGGYDLPIPGMPNYEMDYARSRSGTPSGLLNTYPNPSSLSQSATPYFAGSPSLGADQFAPIPLPGEFFAGLDANMAGLGGLGPLGSLGMGGINSLGMGMPLGGLGMGGPAPVLMKQPGITAKARSVSKIILDGQIPAIKGFVVRDSNAPEIVQYIHNTRLRQHSLSIPSSTTTLDLIPYFHDLPLPPSPSAPSSLPATPSHLPNPPIQFSARPESAIFEPDELPALGRSNRYCLRLESGLTVVEFLVTGGEERGEVYRIFLMR